MARPHAVTPGPALTAVLALGTMLALAACQSLPVTGGPGPRTRHHHRHHQQPATGGGGSSLLRVHDPGTVTYSVKITACHARDGGRLPDRHCTPGSVDPAVTQHNIGSTICRTGWTETVRPPESQTEHAKFDIAYPAYGISDGTTSELDHEVPLELGGDNDITNLWPEAGSLPNPKDSVERALNRAVCDGRVSLAAARRAIAVNWETAEKRLGLG
jgi:hypothetical protein